MDIRQQIVSKMAKDGIADEETLLIVVNDAFFNINKATHLHSSVEISGLGKFVFNKGKAAKMLPNFKNAHPGIENKLKADSLMEMIHYIESK